MIGDTIAAVSTPRGKGGVALLRVSGTRAIEIADRVFRAKNGKPLTEAPARTAVYGSLFLPEQNGERTAIDDGLVTVFRAPASFTGEDTVEICCHGGILLTETVLTALFAAGARPAEAGEFSRRAFLNGKMGLSSAEALADLLEAQNREQLILAHSGMNGKTGAACEEIYEEIRRILSSVYACIDYPDEDLAEMSREEILAALDAVAGKTGKLVATYRTGHAVAEGIRTVICGKPNAGKSSLYNRIVGRDAAIVTDVEGTTRDLLTETAALGRVTLRLCDTAGLRDSEDPVEKIGISRAKEAMENAELIFAVFDASKAPDEDDRALIRLLKNAQGTVVAVLNKRDLIRGTEYAEYREVSPYAVSLSARTGEGMEELRELVERIFTDGSLDVRQDAVLSNARQYAAALGTLEALKRAADALREGQPIDLCCTDAEAAMGAISELDGRAVSEDLVSEIFSHFCVGK